MALIESKGCCLVNCIDLALGVGAQTLARDYFDFIGEETDHDPNEDGYHVSIVNQILVERYGEGMVEIDLRPTVNDKEINPAITDRIVEWFKRPGFRCVVTGIRNSDGEKHANAYRGGMWFDSNGTPMEEPNINLLALHCLSAPKHPEQE